MKITLEVGTVKYIAEDNEAITWEETLSLVRGVLVGMYPYLTDEDIANYFIKNTWTLIKKETTDEQEEIV